MTLVFRTVSSDALLIYTQGSTHVDYLALEIRNGLLYYSYNLGAGQAFISSTPSQTRYDDDTIHTVWNMIHYSLRYIHFVSLGDYMER